jgi:hypothetical protein
MTHSRRLWRDLILELLAFGTLVIAVSLLWRTNLLLAFLMLVEGAVALASWHDAEDLSFLLVIGGMGALAEAAFVRSGAWHYANPSFLGVPLWFPIAFGTAGLIGRHLSITVAALWTETRSPTDLP